MAVLMVSLGNQDGSQAVQLKIHNSINKKAMTAKGHFTMKGL
jgi:hypothetical protein